MSKRKKKAAPVEAPPTEAAPESVAEGADTAATLTLESDPPPPGEPTTLPYFEIPSFEPVTDHPEEVTTPEGAPAGQTATAVNEADWDGPTRVGLENEIAGLAAQSAGNGGGDGAAQAQGEAEGQADDEEPAVESPARLESIVESLLFAADRPLTLADLKRLLNERDGKKVSAALEALKARHEETGIQLAGLAGGWQFRTHPANAAWVSKLVAGRPQRLSRAMLETLSIVAYRQPITRPEIDDIRGVDCGPVLKTLLDRGLVRMIGKKEDVGRPILYGTTPEFLRTFSLRDLSELPTLREFHELSEAHLAEVQAKTEAKAGAEGEAPAATPSATAPLSHSTLDLPHVDPDEEDGLLGELERATSAAARAAAAPPGAAENNPDAPVADAPEAT
jgi:segregation and condensation protein B